MWNRAWLAALLLLTACGGADSKDSSKLTLKNSMLDRVNVQVVVVTGSNCDATGAEVVKRQEFLMVKDRNQVITAPNGATICWRKDRNPANPKPGEWTGWTRAILFPGEDTETAL